MMVFSGALHAASDGVAIGAAFSSSATDGLSTSLAVLFHEVLHGVGKSTLPLKYCLFPRRLIRYVYFTFEMFYFCNSRRVCYISFVWCPHQESPLPSFNPLHPLLCGRSNWCLARSQPVRVDIRSHCRNVSLYRPGRDGEWKKNTFSSESTKLIKQGWRSGTNPRFPPMSRGVDSGLEAICMNLLVLYFVLRRFCSGITVFPSKQQI